MDDHVVGIDSEQSDGRGGEHEVVHGRDIGGGKRPVSGGCAQQSQRVVPGSDEPSDELVVDPGVDRNTAGFVIQP
jgi:hypothetical protein